VIPALEKKTNSLNEFNVDNKNCKVKGLKRKAYEERLKILGIYKLQQRSLRGHLVETYKI